MARAVGVLRRNREGVLLRGEPALEAELHLQHVTGAALAELDLLQSRVGAVDFHPDAIADQDSDHRIVLGPAKRLRTRTVTGSPLAMARHGSPLRFSSSMARISLVPSP